MVDPTGKTY